MIPSLLRPARFLSLLLAIFQTPSALALREGGHEPVRPPCNTERLSQCRSENAAARDAASTAALQATARLSALTSSHLTMSESASSASAEIQALAASSALAASESQFLSSDPGAEREIFPAGPRWSYLLAPALRRPDWELAGRAQLLEKFSTLPQMLSGRASAISAREAETRNEIAALSSEIQAWQAEERKQYEFIKQHAYQCDRGCTERICPAIL